MKNQKNIVFTLLFSILMLTIEFPVNGEIESPKKQME